MIVFENRYDQLDHNTTERIIDWCQNQTDRSLTFNDVLDFASTQQTTTYEDIAQYAIDWVNENAPIGHWYYLTADANIGFDIEGDDQ